MLLGSKEGPVDEGFAGQGLPPPPPVPGGGEQPGIPPIGPTEQPRRRGPIVAIVALVVAAAVGAGLFVTLSGDGRSSSGEEAAVRDLLLLQERLVKEGRYEELYTHFSPAVKASCSLDSFLAGFQNLDPSFDPDLAKYEDIVVVVDGANATVTYSLTYDGEEVLSVTDSDPDLYVKIDGVWFDDLDAYTGC
jgi:hypothetical protein